MSGQTRNGSDYRGSDLFFGLQHHMLCQCIGPGMSSGQVLWKALGRVQHESADAVEASPTHRQWMH